MAGSWQQTSLWAGSCLASGQTSYPGRPLTRPEAEPNKGEERLAADHPKYKSTKRIVPQHRNKSACEEEPWQLNRYLLSQGRGNPDVAGGASSRQVPRK